MKALTQSKKDTQTKSTVVPRQRRYFDKEVLSLSIKNPRCSTMEGIEHEEQW